MKNIQIIDAAENATFSIFQATDAEFCILFPAENQDVQFDDELPSSDEALLAMKNIWQRPVLKSKVMGIHGTIFYGQPQKKEYFQNVRKWSDMDQSCFNTYERELLALEKAK